MAAGAVSEDAHACSTAARNYRHPEAGTVFPANYANLLTGFPTAETLIRSFYASANFSRTHGTPFDYATITDVPSYSWSYASILASAGIKTYSPAAITIARRCCHKDT